MKTLLSSPTISKAVHPWIRTTRLVFIPGYMDALLEEVVGEICNSFTEHGHIVQSQPDSSTDLILTTARWGEVVNWRRSLLFTGRIRFRLDHSPTVVTVVHATREEFESLLNHFDQVLAKEPPDPADYRFPGLSERAYQVLFEQGRRGGPILALERLLQVQTMCIRVLLVLGENSPEVAYHFDLVGAYPRSDASNPVDFYQDIVFRLATVTSTQGITRHEIVKPPISREAWEDLKTPPAMRDASREFGQRGFFTEMIRIADLARVPALADAISSQYSEGCFATWEPEIKALIATVTGSARPVDKDNISDDDLAVIVGVRPNEEGAIVRHVEGKENDPPSSEAVELIGMDRFLPHIPCPWEECTPGEVPVARSKLHGHRGVAAYDPRRVEFVPLDPPYYHYPVSCSTDAQARGIQAAFSRSEALQNPKDPRQVVFTVLPGHGVVIVEKWVPGKVPFQVIWEFMDEGALEIASVIPQGPLWYVPGPDDKRVVKDGTMLAGERLLPGQYSKV